MAHHFYVPPQHDSQYSYVLYPQLKYIANSITTLYRLPSLNTIKGLVSNNVMPISNNVT